MLERCCVIVKRIPRYTIFCVPHCVGVVAHKVVNRDSFEIKTSKFVYAFLLKV